MANASLTQSEADALVRMAKRRTSEKDWDYTKPGAAITIPLRSMSGREWFLLDLRRGHVVLGKAKGTYQNRGRTSVVLLRLDFGGAPHRNPNGEEVPSPHLHVYREGFGDKWAYPVSEADFPNLDDASRTLDDFMRYCNIVQPPLINRGLFA